MTTQLIQNNNPVPEPHDNGRRHVKLGFLESNGRVQCGGFETGFYSQPFSDLTVRAEQGSFYSSSERHESLEEYIARYEGDGNYAVVAVFDGDFTYHVLLVNGHRAVS